MSLGWVELAKLHPLEKGPWANTDHGLTGGRTAKLVKQVRGRQLCLLCVYMPAIDRSLSLTAEHRGWIRRIGAGAVFVLFYAVFVLFLYCFMLFCTVLCCFCTVFVLFVCCLCAVFVLTMMTSEQLELFWTLLAVCHQTEAEVNFALKVMECLLETMSFVLKMMICVPKMMIFVPKMMICVLKMMIFVPKMTAASGDRRAKRGEKE